MATNTASSLTTHTGNGSTSAFAISFSFLADSEIDVTVAGVTKTITTHYTISGSTLTFTSGNIPANGAAIKFQRDTDISAKKVDFQDGSVLTEADLDANSDQVLFAQQEIVDKLGTIEEGATADQTNAEIRAAVEAATDSNVFTDADHTKLNAIEASATADQTAAEIRTLVESASDSNVFTDADHTKLNAIEASATADQTASEIRTLVESATDSNVFTDADHSKLNAIEAGATTDQTDAEIKTAYEANSDTNAFTDGEKTKLSGIETSADVTDATNVNAAGAVMNSDLDTKGEILVGDGSGDPTALSVGQNNYVLVADSNEATGVKWATVPAGSGLSNVVEDTTPQLGGNLDVQASEINTSTTNGNIKLNPNGTGVVEVKGDGSSADGTIQLNCSQNSHGVKIKSPPHSAGASYTLTLPNTDGAANQVLKSDGSGNLDWVNQTTDTNTTYSAGTGLTLSGTTFSVDAIDKISEGNTEAEVVDTGSDGHFKVTTEGTERLRVIADGKVGIGTNTPGELLQIYDASGNPTVHVRANNQNTASLKLENDDGNWAISTGTSSYPLNFAVGGSNKLTIDSSGNLQIPNDTGKLQFGTSQDLQIYHSGTESWIRDVGTSNLYLDTNGDRISLISDGSESNGSMAKFIKDGSVELYYDNAKMLETTSTGVKISNGNRVLNIGQGSNSNYVNLAAESTAGSNAYLDINSYALQIKTDSTTRLHIQNDGNIDIPDSTKLRFGTGDDLEIYHNGTNSVIADVGTGNLSLQTNGTDINFWNGSEFLAKFISNGSVELYYNGSKKLETTSGGAEVQGYFTAGKPTDYWSTSSSYINVANYGGLGTAGGYELTLTAGGYRKGSNQWEDYTINSQSGYAAQVGLNPTNGNIIFRTQSGKSSGDSHAVTERMRIHDTGEIQLPDNGKFTCGASNDLQIYHDGSNSRLKNTTGQLWLQSDNGIRFVDADVNESMAAFYDNGAVELYYDNSKKFETTSTGVSIPGILQMGTTSSYIDLPDNASLYCGTGDDLRIYHDGTHSRINNSTGYLTIKSDQLAITNGAGDHDYISVPVAEQSVRLHYDNVVKFETTTMGARVYDQLGVNISTTGWGESINVGTYNATGYGIAIRHQHDTAGILMRFTTTSGSTESICGSITGSGTSTTYNTSSDYRLKENQVAISDGITRLKTLKPYRFNWIADSTKTLEDGFFAHEVTPAVPEAITGEKDTPIDEQGMGYQQIDQSKLVPLITAALQEAITKIETLETKVAALEAA